MTENKGLSTIEMIERELKRRGSKATITKLPPSRRLSSSGEIDLENRISATLEGNHKMRVKSMVRNRIN